MTVDVAGIVDAGWKVFKYARTPNITRRNNRSNR
jgi:hypothetical protein